MKGGEERLPLIWFIILFPILVLLVFSYLVIKHHSKLYGPGDYKDETNFVISYAGTNGVSRDLDRVYNTIESLHSLEGESKKLGESLTEVSREILRIKAKSETIPIDSLWRLNHWGSNCARVENGEMVFEGTSAPNGTDGSHINLNSILEIGGEYNISCLAKCSKDATSMFQLWCHDDTGIKPSGVSEATDYKTPSINGETIALHFVAKFNKNLRIHLQYQPGLGKITVSDVRISRHI